MLNIDSKVDWKSLDQPAFDRIVEVLITRFHEESDPPAVVDAIDGRGGDAGIDIGVRQDGKLTHIYQLKFFPQGFSGNWARSRKQQIKRSFETAMKHKPARWVLVTPGNPTNGELDFVKSLKHDNDVEIDIIGRAKLDDLLARYPDVQRWLAREPLLEVLKSVQMEREALSQPHELKEAVTALAERANSRSPHWGLDISYTGGIYTETPVPKHSRANELEPLGLQSFRISIPQEEGELAEKARHILGFGDNGELVIQGHYLKDADFKAPSWASVPKAGEVSSITLSQAKEDHEPLRIEFQQLDGHDFIVQSFAGHTTYFGRGSDGYTIRASINGCVEVTVYLATESVPSNPVKINATQSFAGVAAKDVLAGLRFIAALHSGLQIRILFEDKTISTLVSTERTDSGEETPTQEFTRLLAEDLAVLEDELKVQFPIPESIERGDRLEIRIARLLLEGKVVLYPFLNGFNGIISDQTSPSLANMLSLGQASFILQNPVEMSILGRKVSLGTGYYYIKSGYMENSQELSEAIENGTANGLPFRVNVTSGQGIKLFLPDRLPQTSQNLEVVPWELAGVSEHEELRGATSPLVIETGSLENTETQ